MVNCVVPVSADNPLTYNLVLVSLYEQGVSPHAFLHFSALCTPGTRESLAVPNLEHDYLTRKTGRM